MSFTFVDPPVGIIYDVIRILKSPDNNPENARNIIKLVLVALNTAKIVVLAVVAIVFVEVRSVPVGTLTTA
jgi:hypothetical protein